MNCSACGKPWERVEWTGAPSWMTEPSCNCVTCPDCSKTYKADDDEGVSVAATDELAEHHDRKCSACWKKIES